MLESKENLWTIPVQVIAITTNGNIVGGHAVNKRNPMGGGCAREAVERIPGIDYVLGNLLSMYGNHVQVMHVVKDFKGFIISFPTIEQLGNGANLQTVERSCKEVVELVDRFHFDSVAIPRPGCGLGGLDWDTEVKPICEKYLDDRFTIVSF